jgi:hypothetical protein
MSSLAAPRLATSAGFLAPGSGWAAAPASERSTSLALLRARVHRLPGVELADPPPTGRVRTAARGPLWLRIDVRGTGLTGYELGRRMRKFSGVPLEYCEAEAVVALFDDGDDISARGSRLLFALTHALTA